MLADLHIHSIFSDGTQKPEDIVISAKNKKIMAISITDHDTVSGTEEALIAGEKYGVEVFPGVELSVCLDGTPIHILGYCMDYCHPELLTSLSLLQKAREKRNITIIEKLQKIGANIELSEIEKISTLGQTGRPHIAKVLVKNGAVRNMQEAFTKYLKKGCPAYVPRFIFSAEEAIALLKKAGGVAVLAHPAQIDSSLATLPVLLEKLFDFGLGGIELNYPTHSSGMKKKMRKMTSGYSSLYTGGSDYHGDMRPGSSLAKGKKMMISDEVLAQLRNKWKINQRIMY